MLGPVFRIAFNGINALLEVVKALPPGIRELGIVGFLMLGRGGKIAVVAILALLKKMGVDLDELTNKFFKDNADGNMGRTFEKANEFIKKVDEGILASRKSMEELMKAATNFEKQTEKTGLSLQKIKDGVLEQFKKDFEAINTTVAKIATSSIKAFSRSLAEAIVLGKDLNMSMKELAQKIFVDILAFTIQIVLQESIRFLLAGKIFKEKDKEKNTAREIGILNSIDAAAHLTKLQTIKAQNKELEKQKKIQGTTMLMSGNPLGFLGFMASGGSVGKGQPTVVGERGPELFIPNSSGQITQNARGTAGRAVNVNFNITAMDTRGFDEALQENRGTITAIINNALTEKGRGELV